VLAVADQIAPAARLVRPQAVELNLDGSVRLSAGTPTSEQEAEGQLRHLLKELLDAASSLTPALARIAGRPCQDDLPGFVAELEAALIPVNRAAARRALARLSRETARAIEQGLALEPAPEPHVAPVAPRATAVTAPQPETAGDTEFAEVDVVVELESEPLEETRPEPLAARRSVPAPPPLPALPPSTDLRGDGQTPRLGTLMTPSVKLEDPSELTERTPEAEQLPPSTRPLSLPEQPASEAEAAFSAEPSQVAVQAAGGEASTLREGDVRPARQQRSPRRSDIGALLKSFGNESGPSEPELRGELKKIAGLDLTPPPASARGRD
jgi:hypothetical protein